MNYNYSNGLIILDEYYTSVKFVKSPLFYIDKDPNDKSITINFTEGMKSSDLDVYELVEDVLLEEVEVLLDNNYVIINNNYYWCIQKVDYISQYITDFLPNAVTKKDNHLIININPNITKEEYLELLRGVIITNNDDYLFNCTLCSVNKTIYIFNDSTAYKQKRDVYISSVDARNYFIDEITNLTNIQVVTSIDQREIEGRQLLEYFHLSDGLANPDDNINTRIIFHHDYGRLKNNTITFKLNYFTKDISLYERRYHEFLLKNDLNRMTTFRIRGKWSASVDWKYDRLPNELSYDSVKLDNNSKATMLYSIQFEVRVLFFTVEMSIEYPKILNYLVNIHTKDSKNEINGK